MICYKKIRQYKYQLVSDYHLQIYFHSRHNIKTPYIRLFSDGILIIKDGYAWDGATWYPDTKKITRGSLVHDALYQLIRLDLLANSYRVHADKLLQQICIEDGTNKILSAVIFKAVNLFGYNAANEKQEDTKIYIAP